MPFCFIIKVNWWKGIKLMQVALNPKINTIYKIQSNITFCAKTSQEPDMDKFASKSDNFLLSEEIKDKRTQLREEINSKFCDNINLERRGTYIKHIPNCLMFEIKNDGEEIFPVEWTKRIADCNFVYLADRNNDDLADALWEELKKSKDIFEQTKYRTLIHVEGFDRLITKGQNSFENIDSLKDIMVRTANDFGATIVFSTKDPSRLTSEAIQPQRVTRIQVNNSKAELEKYDTFLESQGYFKYYEQKKIKKTTTVHEVKKDKTEAPLKQVEHTEKTIETKNPEIQASQCESGKSSDKSDVSATKQTESSKSNVSGSDTPPPKQSPEQKFSAKTTNSSANHKNEAEIKSPKTPDIPPQIKKTTEKASDGPKAFKIVAILVAIGAAIAGVIYFMKNKTQEVKKKTN